MGSTRRGPWSQAEDNTLLNLVASQGPHNWVRISQYLHTRSPKQCRERYHQNLKPSLNHEPISEEEGELIERLVLEMGKRWAEIARRLKGRSDNAVKNWWNGGVNRRKRYDGKHGDSRRENLRRSDNLHRPEQRPAVRLPPLGSDRNPYVERTTTLRSPLQRVVDIPLSSPSAQSEPGVDAMTPSLVSDNGSFRSISPHRDSYMALPPFDSLHGGRRGSVPTLHAGNTFHTPDSDRHIGRFSPTLENDRRSTEHSALRPSPYRLAELPPRGKENAPLISNLRHLPPLLPSPTLERSQDPLRPIHLAGAEPRVDVPRPNPMALSNMMD
ncbi:MAG: hypothetical protein M4579_000819 [Chaenotheca gracillima]|nr:MAG: hypothetical protein M4579_000819 [Chaenotheca gracillima]